MKVTWEVQVEEHSEPRTYYVCDTCGKEFAFTTLGQLQECPICKNHVCQECAIMTDYWYLESGQFAGDYPDFYCKSCWKEGEAIRLAIHKARVEEGNLWEQWRNNHELVEEKE